MSPQRCAPHSALDTKLTMNTRPNIPDPDAFYTAWVVAHEGLNDAQSAELNARLVLLLANRLVDQALLQQCIDAARDSGAE